MSNERSNKGTALIVVLLLLALGGCLFFYSKYHKSKAEIIDLKATKIALLQDTVEFYKARNGQLVATVAQVTLEKNELDLYNASIKKELKNMKIKLRDAQSITTVSTESNVKPSDIPLKDTSYVEQNKPVTAKSFSWSNPWGGFSGIIYRDTVRQPKMFSRDTITSVGTKVYKYHILCFRFKVVGATLKSTNANPDAHITYTEYVKLK